MSVIKGDLLAGSAADVLHLLFVFRTDAGNPGHSDGNDAPGGGNQYPGHRGQRDGRS